MPPPSWQSSLAGAQIGKPGANVNGAFAICTVEDAFAQTGAYIVRLPAGPLVVATDIHQAACLPLGARPITMYAPKSRVAVWFAPNGETPIILGSVVKAVSDPKLILPDSMVMRSRAGLFEDPMHFSVFSNPKSTIANFSAGRPADTLPGDWGYANDLGMMVLLGRIMASLRASDGAKVEAYWGDDLLRLVGYNLELFTAGKEDRGINDEGEYNEILRLTPYPWEGMGMGTVTDGTRTANGRLQPGSEYAKYEPKVDDQLMIQRYLRFRGYLGDLEKEFICAPPTGLAPETYSAQTKYAGLAEITKHINGAVGIRSAKEVILEKYALIPIPKELIAPEDPLGDNPTNYKAADQLGSGPTYQMPEYVWGDDTDANIRTAQMFDYHAYLFNKYTVEGIAAHTNDWYYPNESALSSPVSTVLYDKELRIGHKFLADLPGFGELVIDERPGHSVRYYRSRSVIQQLDDGSILLEDGYGSQISMKGGSIFFSCVGDVWLQPGRSLVAWAAYDAIIRAGNSADISAARHDVRLKAERNLQMLGGNSGTGGVLIESRADGPSTASDFAENGQQVNGHGITLKAEQSSIQAFGRDVYIGRNQTDSGSLIIDAGKNGTLYQRGKEVLTRATDIASIVIQSDSGPQQTAMALNQSGAMISTNVEIGGSVVIVPVDGRQANLLVGGQVAINKGLLVGEGVATNRGFAARQGAPYVGKLSTDIPITPNPQSLAQNISQEVEQLGTEIDLQEKLAVDSSDTSPGNDDFQRAVGFSCRSTVADLKLQEDNFIIYEARWQQMLRHAGSSVTWDEPVVKAPDKENTRPHPGQEAWDSWEAFGTVDGTNFDYSAKRAIDREGMTETGDTPQKKALKTGYIINVQE